MPSSRLRRTNGDVAASGPEAGAPVALSARDRRVDNVVDSGLSPGQRVTYTLFARTSSGSWEATPGLTVSTPKGDQPTYVVKPGAILVEAGDSDRVVATAGGAITVRLAKSRPDTVLGAGVVLPISERLPAGFLGKIASIHPDGTVTLTAGDLPGVFDYLDLTYDLNQLPAQRITKKDLGSGLHGAARDSAASSPAGSTSDSDSSPGLHPAPNLLRRLAPAEPDRGRRRGESYLLAVHHDQLRPLVRDLVHQDGRLHGGAGSPDAQADIYGNVTAKASQKSTTNIKIGGWGKALWEGGTKVKLSGDKIFEVTSSLTTEGEIAVEIGAEITFGPGVGSDKAGAVAGVDGNWTIFSRAWRWTRPAAAPSTRAAASASGSRPASGSDRSRCPPTPTSSTPRSRTTATHAPSARARPPACSRLSTPRAP